MISEVNAALRDLLKPNLPGRTAVHFTLPSEEGQEIKGLSLFLYNIGAENTGGSAWTDMRDEAGDLVGRRPPVHRFRLCYLVTAWGPDPEKEAELLDQALMAFYGWEDSRLAEGPGASAGGEVLLGMEIAMSGSSGEFWEILEAARVAARPVFHLVVTTATVQEPLGDLARAPEKLDLQPAMTGKDAGGVVSSIPDWSRRDDVEITRREEEPATAAAKAPAKGKGKAKEAVAAPSGVERPVKTWRRIRNDDSTDKS